ncbi:MAG: PqqD family protein [Gemmatimonadales bacterium]|nr:PqqD family protein [Gemmatimonadales bacterium]
MGSSPRIALVFDDGAQRRRFAEHVGPGTRLYDVPNGDELVRLAAAHALDVAVVGVLNRTDQFLPSALRELSATAPEVAIVGVFEPTGPSLDEAADLAREVPAAGFVRRPGARFNYLVRGRAPGNPGPTFTPALLDCMDRLPLFGPARHFALLQALHPSCAASIPEQARELGLSRRNLERWFQGPDLCSAGCFQSVCGAAEAAYLRLVCGLPEREIAPVVRILTRDGVENPQAVSRTIRNALRLGLDELRAGGVPVLLGAVETALRSSRDLVRMPVQWEPDTRYVPQAEVLTVPMEDRRVLVDPTRGLEYSLDAFGMDVWPLVARGARFAEILAELVSVRQEPPHSVRGRLIAWLGELLVLGFIRRERGDAKAGNGE